MGKGKGGRGGRGSRHGGGRDGRKQTSFDPTLDTEMVDAPHHRSERRKQTESWFHGSQNQHGNSGRGLVGRTARGVSHTQQSIFNQSVLRNVPRGQPFSTRATPRISMLSSQNRFTTNSRTKSRRASIGTCISALSTQIGRGPYCYKCARTNRKLRQALFDLLERALKDGKELIDEWAWEAGVSPDHMDCERTKMHIIPEGLRSENEPCHQCKAEMLSRSQSHRMSLFPPQASQAPVVMGPGLPPAETPHQACLQAQQRLNPFIQAAPGVFESRSSPMLASRVPSARPWDVTNALSGAEQTATCVSCVGYPGQVPQPQAQHELYQQQQQGSGSSHIWQVANGHLNGPTHQHPDQVHRQPAVDDNVDQATTDTYTQSAVNQRDRCGNSYTTAQLINNVEKTSTESVAQAQQRVFQHLQHPLNRHLEHLGTITASPATLAPEEDQSRHEVTTNPLITPPLSNEMTITGMLNLTSEAHPAQTREASVDAGAPSQATQQSTEKSAGDVLDPNLAQKQPSPYIPSERGQHSAQKYV